MYSLFVVITLSCVMKLHLRCRQYFSARRKLHLICALSPACCLLLYCQLVPWRFFTKDIREYTPFCYPGVLQWRLFRPQLIPLFTLDATRTWEMPLNPSWKSKGPSSIPNYISTFFQTESFLDITIEFIVNEGDTADI